MKESEKTFQRYAKAYLKEEIGEIEKSLFEKLEKAFKSGAIPDHWKTTGNHLTTKAVIDSFCKDRPYRAMSDTYSNDIDNLHLFL